MYRRQVNARSGHNTIRSNVMAVATGYVDDTAVCNNLMKILIYYTLHL